MKRDPKLNPFDPRNPVYWFRKRLLTTVKVSYGVPYFLTPGQWGTSYYLSEPIAYSVVFPKLIESWNERKYETEFDPHPAEEELTFLSSELAAEYELDPVLVAGMLFASDVDPAILRMVEQTRNMLKNKGKH